MHTCCYSLCDLTVSVTCDQPAQGAAVAALWRRLFAVRPAAPGTTAPALRLRFAPWTGVVPVREPAEAVFRSPGLRVARTPPGFRITSGEATLDVDATAGHGDGVLDDGFWQRPLQDQREFFLLALVMLLDGRGRYGLHANAVVRDDRAVLLVGGSGSGKTTLTLALVRAGWSYLSDDALVLARTPAGIEALALRRTFSCTRTTAVRFPELAVAMAEAPALGEGKRLLDLEPIYPGRLARRCRPSALLFPVIAEARRSRLLPLDETAALVALMRQSAGIIAGRGMAGDQLDVLRLLAGQAPAYTLLTGSDVYDDPGAIAALVEQVGRG